MMFNSRLKLLIAVGLLCSLTYCGRETAAAHTTTSQAADPASPPADHDGTVGAIYTSPHPADCGTCSLAAATATATCPNIVGTSQTCEGVCFVEDSVSPKWNNEPPSSGPEYDAPTFQWGEHTTPVPRGTYVRNLAHGFVVLAYNCPAGCDVELNSIRQVLAANSAARILLTPDPLLNTGHRFAAIAWTWVLNFDEPNTDDLNCFVAQHQGHGIVN